MTSQPSPHGTNAVSEVGSTHADPERSPTVLVAGHTPGFTDLYPAWLGDRYAVETASSALELLAILDEATDVLLLAPRLHGVTAAECLERIRSRGYACRVALVGSNVPASPVDAGFDAALERPVSTNDLESLLDRLLRYRRYDALVRERYRLESERASSDDPEATFRRLETVRSELDELAEGFDPEDVRALFLTIDCDRDAATRERAANVERRVA